MSCVFWPFRCLELGNFALSAGIIYFRLPEQSFFLSLLFRWSGWMNVWRGMTVQDEGSGVGFYRSCAALMIRMVASSQLLCLIPWNLFLSPVITPKLSSRSFRGSALFSFNWPM